jgi:hypothetical protein
MKDNEKNLNNNGLNNNGLNDNEMEAVAGGFRWPWQPKWTEKQKKS